MEDWIAQLRPGQRVLDLGSGTGSFPLEWFPCQVIALDEDPEAFRLPMSIAEPPAGPYSRMLARVESMPFASAAFDLVICHHSLEHIADAEGALREVGRVLKPSGRLLVSVPNGYGLCDGIYRWLFEGGGHVNRFRRRGLAESVEKLAGVRLVRWRRLYSSFNYLRNLAELLRDPPEGLARRLVRFGRRPLNRLKRAQVRLYHATRYADRLLGTELSVYGWALYFDSAGGQAEEQPGFWNVCLYCGTGQAVRELNRVSPPLYRCHNCSRLSPYRRPPGGAV